MAAEKQVQCPRCQHSNDAENQFCDYCGFNLTAFFSKDEEAENPTPEDLYAFPQMPSRLQEYSNKTHLDHSHLDTKRVRLTFKTFKHKKRWAFAAAIIIFVVGGYSYGHFYYSKSVTLNRLVASVSNGVPDHDFVSKRTHHDDTKMIAGYFKANPKLVEHLKSDLGSGNHTSDGFFTYQKTGTHFGIFPKYQVVIDNELIAQKTYAVKIKTMPYALILLNGKVMSYADADGNYHLKHLTSASLKISAKYHYANRGVTTKQIKVTQKDDNSTIMLFKKHLQKRSDGSQQAQTTLAAMYAKVGRLNNKGSDAGKLRHYFVDGKDNRFYQSIYQLAYSFYQRQFKATYRPSVSSFKRIGRNRYVVVYKLTYHFDIGDQIHMQVFKTTAVMQKAQRGYQVISIISDGTPIKDKYYKKD